MKASIIDTQNFKVVGLKVALRTSLDQKINMSGIAGLWAALRADMDQVLNRIGTDRFTLITGDLTEREPTSYYYALIQVENFEGVPAQFDQIDLSNKRVAFFWHKGSPATSGKTAMRVMTEWLPASGESVQENLELIRLAESYNPRDPEGTFEYGIFI